MEPTDQAIINRANAEKSTGPKTPEGKQRSRANAFRHGLTGHLTVLSPEDREPFEKHCAGIVEALNPAGQLEIDIAQSIAEDRWRLKRVRAIENGIFALGESDSGGDDGEDPGVNPGVTSVFSHARAWLAEGKNLQLLTLYEQRIHRSLAKSMQELRTLQEERRQALAEALAGAHDLAALAAIEGQPYDPAQDLPAAVGLARFVCSPEEFLRLLERDRRLNESFNRNEAEWDADYQYPIPPFRFKRHKG